MRRLNENTNQDSVFRTCHVTLGHTLCSLLHACLSTPFPPAYALSPKATLGPSIPNADRGPVHHSHHQPRSVSPLMGRQKEKRKGPLPLLLKVKKVGNKSQEVNKRTHIHTQAKKQRCSEGFWEQTSTAITPGIMYESLPGRRMSGH